MLFRSVVTLFEQNPPDATFGFGVVFSDRAMDFLREDDPETADLISPRMEQWQSITVVHRGEPVVIDGVGFAAIGRLDLLQLLQRRAAGAGVLMRFQAGVRTPGDLSGFDLIVAADGVNSTVRTAHERDFGASRSFLGNRFAWFGTPARFNTLTQTFVASDMGTFNAHHYRYSPAMSTFIVECDPLTWQRAGFEGMPAEASRALCERVFADTLQGAPLVANHSVWRTFPWIHNDRWSYKNIVLIGDALHTAHYSIGSGTRLALEDALALVHALEAAGGDVAAALERYEAARRPIVEKLVQASRASAEWYEKFPDEMRRGPLDFAYSYITRTGRVDTDRLSQASPQFMERYRAR